MGLTKEEMDNKYRGFLLWLEKKGYLKYPVNTDTVVKEFRKKS